MKNNRILIFVLLLLLVLLLALGGLFIWLSGGTEGRQEDGARTAQGLVHVRSIYVANGENLVKPVGIGADTDGSFFVTLRDGQRVVEFDRSGDWVRTFGEKGLGQGQLMVATGVAVDRLAGHVYVTDRSRLRLICYSPQGEFLWEVPLLNPLSPVVTPDGIVVTTFGPLVSLTTQGEPVGEVGSRGPDVGQFDYARSAAVLEGGDIVIADSNNNRVQRVKVSGEVTATSVWVDGEPPRFQDDPAVTYGLPSGVTADTRGRVFVLDGFRQEIVVLDARTGKRLHVFEDLQGKRDGHFSLPTGIAHLGGDRFAITDTYNDRVQIVRLLLPGEDQLVARYPWLWGALPAGLFLLLAMVLGRKRHFATRAALGRASDEGHLRLLAAVGRRLRVLPEVLEEFADVEEAGIGIGEYLMAVGTEGDSDASQRLLDAARPVGWRRVLPARSRLIVRDDGEAAEFAGFRGRIMTVDQMTETYTVGEPEDRAHKAPSSESEASGNSD